MDKETIQEGLEKMQDNLASLNDSTEEAVEEVVEEAVEEVVAESVETDIEAQAREMGWNPEGPKSAEEFVQAAPLYDEIHKLRKTTKEQQKALKDIKDMMEKQREAGYQQALEDLEAEKLAAVELGDVESYQKTEQQIQEIKQEAATEPNQAAVEFTERRSRS